MAEYTTTITISDPRSSSFARLPLAPPSWRPRCAHSQVDAWQAAHDFEVELTAQVGGWDSPEAKRVREASGYEAMSKFVESFACDLDTAAGGSPTWEPEWLEAVKRSALQTVSA